jgi:hypothetical protein
MIVCILRLIQKAGVEIFGRGSMSQLMKRIAVGILVIVGILAGALMFFRFFNVRKGALADSFRHPAYLNQSTAFYQWQEFVDDVAKLVGEKKYEKLEVIGSDVLKGNIRFANGTRSAQGMRIALVAATEPQSVEGWLELEAQVKDWERAFPNSIWPRCVRLEAIISYADWLRGDRLGRGKGQKNPDAESELRRAQTLFNEYAAAKEQSYMLYTAGMAIGMRLGEERSHLAKLFEKARALDPASSEPYLRMATYLSPAWYGEKGEAAQFLANETPPTEIGDLIYFWVSVNLEDDYRNVLEKLDLSYERIEKGAVYGRSQYDEPSYFDNWRAYYAGRAVNLEKTRTLLKEIGTDVLKAAWRTPETLHSWRRWAGVEDAPTGVRSVIKPDRDYRGRPTLVLKTSSARAEVWEMQTGALELLWEKNYVRLEEIGRTLAGRKLSDGTDALPYFLLMPEEYRASSEKDWAKMEEAVQGWERAYPDSSLARAVHLKVLTRWAWWHRGGSWAYKVKSEAWEPFLNTLTRALDLFEGYRKSGERNAAIYAEAIIIAMGLGKAPEYTREIFNQGRALDPMNVQLYERYMWNLAPRWHGKAGDSETVLNALPDEEAYNLLYAVAAFYNFYLYDHSLKNTQLSYERIRKGCEYGAARHQDSSFYLNFLAKCALQAGDQSSAKMCLEKIGRIGHSNVWQSVAEFRAARNAVGLE